MNVNEMCLDERSVCFPRIIWSYWEQSIIPEDIDEMINVSKKSLVNFTHVLLSADNLSAFLNVSSFPSYYQKLWWSAGKTCYFRYCLLERYGGVYLDASTFIFSGDAMEWFFLEGIRTKCEIVNFEWSGWPLIDNFLLACTDSVVIKKIKNFYDEVLEMNQPIFYCQEICKKRKIGVPCSSHEYSATIVAEVLISHPGLKSKVLYLPRRLGNYALQSKYGWSEIGRLSILCDPIIKSLPFVKLTHGMRNGKKIGIGNECTEKLRLSKRRGRKKRNKNRKKAF